MTTDITIRPMNECDVPELLRLMRAIVSFERGQNFTLNEAELLHRGFGKQPEFGAYSPEWRFTTKFRLCTRCNHF